MFSTFRNKLPNKTTLRVLTVTGFVVSSRVTYFSNHRCRVHIQFILISDLGCIGDVDVRWVYHARVRHRTDKKRVRNLYEEPWSVLNRLYYVLRHWLRFDVHRRLALYR